MKNKKRRQNSKGITNTDQRERLNRRRFVKGVAMGGVLAFGMGIPTPATSQAETGFFDSIFYSPYLIKPGKKGKRGNH